MNDSSDTMQTQDHHMRQHREICEIVAMAVTAKWLEFAPRAIRRAFEQNRGGVVTAEMVSAALAVANLQIVIEPCPLSPEALHRVTWPQSDMLDD